MNTRATLSVALSLLVVGCEKPPPPKPPPPKIPVVAVTTQDVPVYMEAIGETLGSLDIAVRARVEGTIDKVHFEEGANVEKGAKLYSIDPAPFIAKVNEAKGQLAGATAQFVRADSDLKRVRPLVEIDALSRRTLDAAIADYDASQGLVDAMKALVTNAEIDLSYTEIEAPLEGLIGVSEAYQGDFVGRYPNPIVLTTISKLDPIRVRFSISERDYVAFIRKQGSTPEVRGEPKKETEGRTELQLFLVDGYEHPYRGLVNFAGREIDRDTGTLMIEAEFPNPQKTLRPGQFARVRAVVETKKNATLVPQRAVTELQGIYQLYVIDDENKAHVRQVKTGVRVGELWLIEEGVKAGERVVVSGLHLVRPGMIVDPVAPEVPEPEKAEQRETGK